jgi:hypothetical protein
MTGSILLPAFNAPALIRPAGQQSETRFWEFFAGNIRNQHTRRVDAEATREFLAWCERAGGTCSSGCAGSKPRRRRRCGRNHIH